MNNLLRALTMAVGIVFVGCEQRHSSQIEQVNLQEKLLPYQNPTSYEFDAGVADVKDAIGKAFGQEHRTKQWREAQSAIWKGKGDAAAQKSLTDALRWQGAMLLWKGEADVLTRGALAKPGTENDAYLYGGGTCVGESQTYFKEGQPLIYYADFHIHLTAMDERKTRIEIFTYESCVVAGLDESWSPHGPSLIFVQVDPTTVEQYQILLGIGEQLGTKNMPQLITPAPDAQVKQLILPRER
jgi:hypothetical protein